MIQVDFKFEPGQRVEIHSDKYHEFRDKVLYCLYEGSQNYYRLQNRSSLDLFREEELKAVESNG